MPEIVNLSISKSAAAELSRQASFAGTPGEMFIDLINDSNDEGWLHIRLQPGSMDGSPISRTEGITLFADSNKFSLFKGLTLDYYSDLSGGGFLISTPETGVDSIMVTYAMMDFPMTIIRPLSAFISASFAGVLQHFFNDFDFKSEKEVKSCCHKSDSKGKKEREGVLNKIKKALKFSYVDLLDDIANWLAVGILMGALIDYYVPVDLFLSLNGTMAKILILFVGIPMYVCASATTPIAAALVAKGLSPGAALIFLLVGPATNISNILVLQKYIGKKGVALNIFSIALVSLGASYGVDFLYGFFSWPVDFKISHQHGHVFSSFEYAAAIVFILLLIFSLTKINFKELKRRLK